MIDYVCWNITNKCNDSCSFCFRDIERVPLTLSENITIAEKIIKSQIRRVTFSGGEALLYKNLFALVELFSKYDFDMRLITNCIL